MALQRNHRVLEQAAAPRDLRSEQEHLINRIEHHLGPLSSEQKALLAIVLRHGGTFQQVARLRGEHASTVSRRFRRLLSRLNGRGLPRCQPLRLSPLERAILAEYYLCGRTQNQIAVKLDISRYRVRKTLIRLQNSTRKTSRAAGGAA